MSGTPASALDDRVTLRFLATPADTAAGGRSVAAGSVMEWIDKAGYACAVGWAGAYCVTAYVGNVRHRRPIPPGSLIEVRARIVHTGRTSMHVVVTVSSAEVSTRAYTPATTCVLIFVAKDAEGRTTPVPPWSPASRSDRKLAEAALERIETRARIKHLMLDEEYTEASAAPHTTLRFLAPTGVVPETIYLATDRDTVLRRMRARAGTHSDDFVLPEDLVVQYVDHFEPPTPDEGPLTVVR